jgi:predicted RNase H-like HicB family nuclease
VENWLRQRFARRAKSCERVGYTARAMLSKYLAAAMHRAMYDLLADDSQFYAEIPGLDGVYATGTTLEECRDQLAEVLEEWVVLGISMHHRLPPIDGIEITVGQVA